MITDKEFDLLKYKIKKNYGINLGYYKTNFIKRRVEIRLHKKNISASKYISSLDKEEYGQLFKALSINVTEFFRDPKMWELFQDLILPNIVFYKKEIKKEKIRVWCAGCASGEEAYTIAIILKEFLQDEKFIIEVIGTDIDETALERAKIGIYQKERLKNLSKKLLNKYFFTDGTWYEVNEDIKKLVKFKSHDLIHDKTNQNFDVIFCRNVIIYFSKDLQETLFENFCNALNKFGFLILGKAEAVTGEHRKDFAIVDLEERVYRKL